MANPAIPVDGAAARRPVPPSPAGLLAHRGNAARALAEAVRQRMAAAEAAGLAADRARAAAERAGAARTREFRPPATSPPPHTATEVPSRPLTPIAPAPRI